MRQAEVELERELYDAELEKLTTRERDIRRRIEDLCAAHPESDPEALQRPQPGASNAAKATSSRSVNGTYTPASAPSVASEEGGDVKVNDVDSANVKMGKKRKMEAR